MWAGWGELSFPIGTAIVCVRNEGKIIPSKRKGHLLLWKRNAYGEPYLDRHLLSVLMKTGSGCRLEGVIGVRAKLDQGRGQYQKELPRSNQRPSLV